MLVRRTAPRRGATLVEAALVYPVLFLLLFSIITLSIGVFRKQQVTHIAREAARYASVHGTDYAKATGQAVATKDSVYAAVIQPQAGAMANDLTRFSYDVVWPNGKTPTHDVTVGTVTVPVSNTVTVTVTYYWDVVPYFGPLTLTSTSTAIQTF